MGPAKPPWVRTPEADDLLEFASLQSIELKNGKQVTDKRGSVVHNFLQVNLNLLFFLIVVSLSVCRSMH